MTLELTETTKTELFQSIYGSENFLTLTSQSAVISSTVISLQSRKNVFCFYPENCFFFNRTHIEVTAWANC